VALQRNSFGQSHAITKEKEPIGGKGMDVSTFVILEDVLNEVSLRPRVLPDDSRLSECVTVARACMKLIEMDPMNHDYAEKILQALLELAKIARRNGEYIVAGRLRTIVYRLSLTTTEAQRRAKTA
jgi:hypothetical protein